MNLQLNQQKGINQVSTQLKIREGRLEDIQATKFSFLKKVLVDSMQKQFFKMEKLTSFKIILISQFYLKDIGSTTGTFIKIDGKIQLNVGMMIELGSNQFFVESMNLNQQEMVLQIYDGPNQPDKFAIKFHSQKLVYSIGRKSTADFAFTEDHHLSNIHAKIVLIDGFIYLEDMGSTNGSWLRLSKEGLNSEQFLLNHETTFKIGTTSTYTCYKQQGVLREKNNTYSCIICCENDRDALYLPCKHNTACLRCSKNLRDCPICRAKIEDTIRIYKN